MQNGAITSLSLKISYLIASTGTSVILRKEVEAANKEVTNVLQSATEKDARGNMTRTRRKEPK